MQEVESNVSTRGPFRDTRGFFKDRVMEEITQQTSRLEARITMQLGLVLGDEKGGGVEGHTVIGSRERARKKKKIIRGRTKGK